MYGYGYYLGFNGSVSGSPYDPDAQIIFDTLGDVPDWFKMPTSDLIEGFKNINVWANTNFYFIICIPSLSSGTACLMDIKSKTVIGTFNAGGGIDAYQSNYRTWGTIDGYRLWTSWLDVGFTPAAKYTLNSSCDVMCLYEAETSPAVNDYNYCVFNSATQFIGMTARSNTGLLRTYSYTNTIGASGAGSGVGVAGAEGTYLMNRTASNYEEGIINGVVVGTTATVNTGTLPTRTIKLNATDGGTPSGFRNKSRFSAWGIMGEGLNSTRRDSLCTILDTFLTAVGRKKSLKTKQIIWDGNSFNAIWYHALQSAVQYSLGDDRSIHWEEFTASGLLLRSIDTAYATNVGPLYNAGYTDNIYILNEFTNDYFTHGNLAATKGYIDSVVLKAKTSGYQVIVVGQPVRIWSGASGTASQTVLNLGLDELNQYCRDQAPIQGFTYVELPSNIWIWRADYASDAAYNSAVLALLIDTNVFHSDRIHPLRPILINDWAPLIVSAIQSLL